MGHLSDPGPDIGTFSTEDVKDVMSLNHINRNITSHEHYTLIIDKHCYNRIAIIK